MKVAALYDIHGMPWALEAVLGDLDADTIVIGGDFVYGPYPAETLERVRGLDAEVVQGNCESSPDEWDRDNLTDEQLEWAASLPLAVELDGVTYCHAAPSDNTPITTAATPDEAVAETFRGLSGTFVIGHTHHQFDRTVDGLRIVNAGAVGMPYESEVAAFWTVVEDGEPRHMRTPIDVECAVREIRASGWPMSEEFIAENLLVAADREQSIAAIESRR
jgi:predicted phosphodiesterase